MNVWEKVRDVSDPIQAARSAIFETAAIHDKDGICSGAVHRSDRGWRSTLHFRGGDYQAALCPVYSKMAG